MTPLSEHPWESRAVFNGCPVVDNDKIHLIYRAMQPSDTPGIDLDVSTIGHAVSKDGVHFENRKMIIHPEEAFDAFGCEDPRVTYFDGTYYIFYTALSEYPLKPQGIKIAVALTKDFKTITERHLVTPFNAKAMTLFPEKIGGSYYALLTIHSDLPPSKIAYARFDKLEDMWSPEYWDRWYASFDNNLFPDLRRGPTDHVEVGAPPLKTDKGWLLIYSHIQDYFTDRKVFGIEALLLDKFNPQKIIGRTRFPFMVPEETYERVGILSNIIFPSGAYIDKEDLHIYYGGCDMRVCRSSVNLNALLESMVDGERMKEVVRFENNPIIKPIKENEWEGSLTFNPGAIYLDGSTHIIYRAMSEDNTSTFGYARSNDGLNIDERLDYPIYVPRVDYELKRNKPDGFSGCEDPRLVHIGDRIYITYTAYNGVDVPRVAVSSISVNDFQNKKWEWDEPVLLTPQGIDDKDACIVAKPIGGKYMVLHRVNSVIVYDFLDDLSFKKDLVYKNALLFGPRKGMWDSEKVGIAGPPMETEDGWLLLYHGVSRDGIYRVGAILLDKLDPTIILGRTDDPILEPEEDYEKIGDVPNVVFPCGSVIRDGIVFIYYGGADAVVGVATVPLSKILDTFRLQS